MTMKSGPSLALTQPQKTFVGVISTGLGTGLLLSFIAELFGATTEAGFQIGFLGGALIAGGIAMILQSANHITRTSWLTGQWSTDL